MLIFGLNTLPSFRGDLTLPTTFLAVANPDGGDACIFPLIITRGKNLGKVIRCFKLGHNDYIN
ncbi:hypothetical protein C5Y97_07475 [Blastopirellula marina]|uniref:Uncharacterized protein n=1 Tax=Blastopirellula marina TaxID=124 RepID=A0A2S8G0G2_9BACT|nr:hypothetical protein C5Y98_07475 [Blastopirellula marina]PTL44583.1 hypothetical protein C5Y97_07475 [Blastopirellula marina]